MTQLTSNLLLGSTRTEIDAAVKATGAPTYRAQQLMEAIYRTRVESIDQVSTLPQTFRADLVNRGYSIGLPTIENRFISTDGTVRYLVGLADGQTVETVWMPGGG